MRLLVLIVLLLIAPTSRLLGRRQISAALRTNKGPASAFPCKTYSATIPAASFGCPIFLTEGH